MNKAQEGGGSTPGATAKRQNDIALRLYRLKYAQLNEFSQEFVDDVLSTIDTTVQERLTRLIEAEVVKELEKLLLKTGHSALTRRMLHDRIAELQQRLPEGRDNA